MKAFLAFIICLHSGLAFAQPIKMTVRQNSHISNKLNFGLQQVITQKMVENQNLSSHFVLGLIRIKSKSATASQVTQLFNDSNTVIRMILPSQEGSIITFSSSLQGVLNAAASDAVVAIQMSEFLGSTSGMTVGNSVLR